MVSENDFVDRVAGCRGFRKGVRYGSATILVKAPMQAATLRNLYHFSVVSIHKASS